MENQSDAIDLLKEPLVDVSAELESSDAVANDEIINGHCGENIFQYFHDKYYDYKLKTDSQNIHNDDNENSNSDNENILILQSMIQELDDEIKKIDDKHIDFLRFLSMKIFLHHAIAKSLEDTCAVDILERVITEAKPYICEPQVIYCAFLVMNFIASIKQKNKNSTDLIKAKEILENCQEIYKIMNSVNKDNIYYTSKELFSQEKEMPLNNEAMKKYEKLVISNLLLLGSVYQKLNEHYKDIVCYHKAFKRMLNKGLVSPYRWVDFTTRLACVFIDDNNFKDARHHLAAATHVHEILEAKNSIIGDSIKKDIIRNNCIHLALAWVRYCVLLFEKSKDEDRKKFAILFKSGYLNPSYYLSSKESCIMPDEANKCDKSLATDEKIFQNANFIESINKEIVDEFSGILNESCMRFGNFFDNIMRSNSEGNRNKKTNELFFPENNLVDNKKQNPDNANEIIKNTDILSAGMNKLNSIQEDIETTEDDLRKEEVEERKEEVEERKEEVEERKEEVEERKEEVEEQKEEVEEQKEEVEERKEEVEERKEEVVNDKSENEIENSENEINENNLEEEKPFETEILVADEKDETDENSLNFTSLGYLPMEHTVPKDLIQSPDEAKCLFKFAYGWSRRAQTYYPRNSDYYSYINVILNMVSLYRLCAYFQGRDNLEYRISLEQTRESLLEHLVTELNEVQPESHLHVRLYQEMALLNVDLAMLNMCNIHNICADETYKLCALKEVQFHINHVNIVGDMLEKSSKMFSEEDMDGKDCENENITSSDKLEVINE